MNIWQFQGNVSRRLLIWAGISALNGVVMLIARPREKFLRGLGSQFLGWAAINAAIALVGSAAARQRERTLPDAYRRARMVKEARSLSRLLWINAGLDILYILGGSRYGAVHPENEQRVGVGFGIVLQGLALFAFDVLHGLAIRPLLGTGRSTPDNLGDSLQEAFDEVRGAVAVALAEIRSDD